MLENLIFFFLSQEISKTFEKKEIDTFLELKVSSIEEKISDKKIEKKSFGKAGLVMDLKSSAILWGKKQETQLPMASLTKLMSILIILENHKLNEKVKIDGHSAKYIGARMDIEKGEIFTVGNLLKGALLNSGNNAITALAKHNSKKVEDFVKKMNIRAKEMGLKNTKFKNPTGLDAKGHYSSVKDLSILAKFVYKYDFVKKISKRSKMIVFSEKGREVELNNTNYLLSNEVVGLKTGTTKNAKQCLITIIKKDEKELLFVLLGSESRFSETRNLIKFVFDRL